MVQKLQNDKHSFVEEIIRKTTHAELDILDQYPRHQLSVTLLGSRLLNHNAT